MHSKTDETLDQPNPPSDFGATDPDRTIERPGKGGPRRPGPLSADGGNGNGAPSPADDEAPCSLQGLQLGEILDGKYAIGRKLGVGGMGVVYEGTHVLLHRKVAIKVMLARESDDTRPQQQFLAEGRNLARVGHPNVVEIFDLGVAGGLYYIVMAYLEGETLAARLIRAGRLPLPDVYALGHQLLSGLAAAHERGIVHRDIKPENVFLAKTADGHLQAKLLDFGISMTIAAGQKGKSSIAGTPSYMAPEQAIGGMVDERTDIYGLGSTLYEAVTGKPAFDGKNALGVMVRVAREAVPRPSIARPDLPARVEAALLRAMAKRRDDRFQSAREMLEASGFAKLGAEATGADERYVLIAEADPVAAARCREIAADLGRTAILARDGAEALELVRGMGPPAVLFVNLSLPRLDGFALLKEIRKTLPAATLPAVAASGAPALRDAAWARRDALGLVQVLSSLAEEAAVREAFARVLPGVPPSSLRAPPAIDRQAVERKRLQQIAATGLVDDLPPPQALQKLVADVAEALGVPIALVSLVLEDRQWFKAHFGLAGDFLKDRGTARDWAFCNHVVAEGAPLVVPDARDHPVFGDNPFVQSGAIRGYAGAPVVAASGEVLGTLCIVDDKPLHLGADVLDALFALARRVGGELDVLQERAPVTLPALATQPPSTQPSPRPSPIPQPSPRPSSRSSGSGPAPSPQPSPRPSSSGSGPARVVALPSLADHDDGSDMRLHALLRDPSCGVLLTDDARRIVHASEGLCQMWGLSIRQVVGTGRDEFLQTISARSDDPASLLRELSALPRGPFVAFTDVPLGGTPPRRLRWHAKPLVVPQGVWTIETYRIET